MACQNNTTTITIVDKISSPLVASLLSIHPNDAALLGGQEIPSQWSSWWAWASDDSLAQPAWLQLVRYYTRPCGDDGRQVDIPSELCSLVDAVRSLQLERTPSAYDTHSTGDRAYRMSPKKAHEVDRMSAYIHQLVHSESPQSVRHAVDVGSGQGYLSRALQELGFHVLALDNNENRTSGANRWTTKEAGDGTRKGSVTHRTVHVCPRTLDESITDWLSDPPRIQGHKNSDVRHPQTPIPVLMVALHACGSLTIDVLRTFLSDRSRTPQAKGTGHLWRPHSLVVVGCCYNLMSPRDFPLSRPLRDIDPIPKLTIAARHLAAQVPSQWLKDEGALRSAELALRKVVYRALLQPALHAVTVSNTVALSERPIQPGLGETFENRRLGKLNDKVYQDWPTFLEHATDKLAIDLGAISMRLPDWFTYEAARLKMASVLYVLQTLRCILGPLIETLILLDRRDWIKERLTEMNNRGEEVGVEMVSLFDQTTGSGRNVALVINPAKISQKVCSAIERS